MRCLQLIRVLVLACLVSIPFQAQADEFTVTNLDDSGPGSLRDAIAAANALVGTDDVVFQAGLTGTIALTSQIEISESVNINGPGPDVITLDGGESTRIFEIPANVFPLEIRGLTFTRGAADRGGAIRSESGMTLEDCAFTDNTAVEAGGALAIERGFLRVRKCLFAGNQAGTPDGEEGGGAIFHGIVEGNYFNTTFSGNVGIPSGGAIFTRFASVILVHSTVVFNEAIVGESGTTGGIYTVNGLLFSRNSIVTQNLDSDGDPTNDDFRPRDGSNVANADSSLIGVDARLGLLQDNGGPTATHVPLFGSPAIDAGKPEHCDDDPVFVAGMDQRGFPRFVDAKDLPDRPEEGDCDIGAVEVQLDELPPRPPPRELPASSAGALVLLGFALAAAAVWMQRRTAAA